VADERARGFLGRAVDSCRAPGRAAALAVLFAALSLLLVRCSNPRATGALPEVQILLDRDLLAADVALPGAYQVRDGSGSALASGRRLTSGRLESGDRAISLNGVTFAADEIVLSPADEAPVQYRGKSYAGDLRVRRDRAGRLEVCNVIDIEEYLAGVLFSEMPPSFPDEALKAQAVAARTYARWRLDHGDPLLRATDADQVYGGVTQLQERARDVVAASRGVILEVDGETLCSYFMSTCGGATVDAPLVFEKSAVAGLRGVPCEWCRASPKYRWTRTLATSELARRLALKDVVAIDVQRDRMGHAIRFDVRGSGGGKSLAAQDFRRAWNAGAASDAEKLPSGWARTLTVDRQQVLFDGSGFGHGVGLCQFGAAGLAKAGKEWREIVGYYYRGAKLVKRW